MIFRFDRLKMVVQDRPGSSGSSSSDVILAKEPELNPDGSWPPLHPDSIPEWVRKVWPAMVRGYQKKKLESKKRFSAKVR